MKCLITTIKVSNTTRYKRTDTDLYFTGITKDMNPNFMIIRDLFRQSVNERRYSHEPMVRGDELQNLKYLKEVITNILDQFAALNSKPENIHNLSYKTLNDFISDAMSDQEALRSEIWKLEVFANHIATVAQEQEKLCSSIDMDLNT